MSGPSEISQFDSQLMRRIGTSTPPGSGVTSYNGLTGAVTGVSSVNGNPGPAVVIPPGVQSVNGDMGPAVSFPFVSGWNGLTGDVRGTLDSIFTFGALDDPFNDNVFEMPTGIRRFRSFPVAGTDTSWPNDVWAETPGAGADPNVGAWGAVRAQETGGNLISTFDTHSVYNPDYVSNVIDGSTWIATLGLMTATLSDVYQVGDPMFRKTYYGASFFGQQPISLPDAGFTPGIVMYEFDDLFIDGNNGPNVQRARQLSGWGQQINYTRPQNNGITPGYIGAVVNATDVLAPAAGDGNGLWFTYGGVSAANIVGQFETHQRTADPAGSWGLGLWTFDPDFGPYQIAELNQDEGIHLFRGGLVLPYRNTAPGGEPLSSGTDAKICWDDNLQQVMISVDGNPFVPLSNFS